MPEEIEYEWKMSVPVALLVMGHIMGNCSLIELQLSLGGLFNIVHLYKRLIIASLPVASDSAPTVNTAEPHYAVSHMNE